MDFLISNAIAQTGTGANEAGVINLLFPLIFTLPIVFVNHRLAQQKHKNVLLWTILGLVPWVNLYALWYLVGTVNDQLEEKIDRLITLVDENR